MKKLFIAASLALAPLAACTPNQVMESLPVVGNVCEAAERTFIDEKVVIGAQTLYIVSGEAYLEAVNDGHLPEGERRNQIKTILNKMYTLQNAIRAARGTANCDFTAMKELHSEVILLIPRS